MRGLPEALAEFQWAAQFFADGFSDPADEELRAVRFGVSKRLSAGTRRIPWKHAAAVAASLALVASVLVASGGRERSSAGPIANRPQAASLRHTGCEGGSASAAQECDRAGYSERGVQNGRERQGGAGAVCPLLPAQDAPKVEMITKIVRVHGKARLIASLAGMGWQASTSGDSSMNAIVIHAYPAEQPR